MLIGVASIPVPERRPVPKDRARAVAGDGEPENPRSALLTSPFAGEASRFPGQFAFGSQRE